MAGKFTNARCGTIERVSLRTRSGSCARAFCSFAHVLKWVDLVKSINSSCQIGVEIRNQRRDARIMPFDFYRLSQAGICRSIKAWQKGG